MIKWNALALFCEAAKWENFTKAAKELYVTQPLVSQAISSLEKDLGVKLFHRQGTRVRLTPEGEYLFQQASPSLEKLETVTQNLRNPLTVPPETLTIAASDTICRHYLLDTFQAFREQNPHISLDLVNQPSPKVLELVEQGRVKLGFIYGTDFLSSHLYFKKIMGIKEVFFTSQAYKRKIQNTSLEHLSTHPLIALQTNTSTRRVLDEALSLARVSWVPEIQVISIDLMIDLVRLGFGIGFTHQSLIRDKEFVIIDTQCHLPKRYLMAVFSRKEELTKGALSFLALTDAIEEH